MNDITIPTIDINKNEVHNVINELYTLGKNSKDVRSKDFTLEDGTKWTSWTIKEYIYKKNPEILPSMARGLFTKNEDKHIVVARGYDKFFNLFEVEATQWDALDKNTKGPYEITAKENGCIILISSLSKDKIVVTSKHSIPEIKTDTTAHAGVGYNWVIKHLSSVGMTEKDLAKWLFEKRVTLVGELCDDNFQEHILPYTGKYRGLYLHGINYNTITLYTLSSDIVKQVALKFGFHLTSSKNLNTIQEVQEFTEDMKRTGFYDGKESEGVVVRCKKNDECFMFKIKNDQYLQYREYREVTKSLLRVDTAGSISLHPTKTPKFRYKKTKDYIDWVKKKFIEDPEYFKNYKSEKGIVRTRQEFEKYLNNKNQHELLK